METKIYSVREIPELHPSNFTQYNSARHSGHYIWMRIGGDVLEVDLQGRAEPLGKTDHPHILANCEQGADLAILFDVAGWGKLWFHLEVIQAALPPETAGLALVEPGRRNDTETAVCPGSGQSGLVLTDYTKIGTVVVILCAKCQAEVVSEDQTFPPEFSIMAMPIHAVNEGVDDGK